MDTRFPATLLTLTSINRQRTWSINIAAPVYINDLSGNIVRIFGCKKKRQFGHILRAADTSQGDVLRK